MDQPHGGPVFRLTDAKLVFRDANTTVIPGMSAEDSGELIKIQYVFENDCWPGEHGEVDFAAAPSILRRQADAYLESYLRRRNGS